MQNWYAGSYGGQAVAELLFGKFSPSGRLPVTFYKSLDDLPAFTDYAMEGRTYRYLHAEPLYPFGYGLSYAKFTFSDLTLSETSLPAGEGLRATVTVKNESDIPAATPVEFYVRDEEASTRVPHFSLCAFDRVELAPGESRTVTVEIAPRALCLVTEAGEVVLAEIRETLRAYDHIREAVAELKGETSGRLRLGVIPTIAPYLLHKFIPDFVRDYPKVELEIAEMVTADIVDALRRDRIDAALVAGGTCGEGIQEHELFDDRFHLYVSRENPLFERTNVRIEDIDLKELVLLSPGHCMRDQIIELCQAKREVPSHYTFESGSLDTLMRIVDSTHCVTIIPEMAVEYIPAEHRCQVKTLAKGATSRKIAVAVRRTYVKSSIIKALIDTILSKVSRQ